MTAHFPWRSLTQPVDLDIVGLAIDGTEVEIDALMRGDRRLPVRNLVEGSWQRAELAIEVRLPEDVGYRLQRETEAVGVVGTFGCQKTMLRLAVGLEADDDPFVRRGTIGVGREEVFGKASLQAVLTAEVDGVEHRMVGTSVDWAIDFDEPGEAPPTSKSPFKVIWDDFGKPQHHPMLATLGSVPFFVDLSDTETPVLYLNQGIENLNQLLTWETAKGMNRTVRDLVADAIAAQALNVVMQSAIAVIEENEGEVGLPGVPLFDRALEALAEHMDAVSGRDELLERALAARRNGDEAHLLQAQITATVERLCRTGETVGRAAGQVISG